MSEKKRDEVAIRFGQYIKAARLRLDMTQEEAANRLDISQSTLQRFENGLRGVELPMAIKICRLYGLDLNEFADSL